MIQELATRRGDLLSDQQADLWNSREIALYMNCDILTNISKAQKREDWKKSQTEKIKELLYDRESNRKRWKQDSGIDPEPEAMLANKEPLESTEIDVKHF
jgi:hypothetical protein